MKTSYYCGIKSTKLQIKESFTNGFAQKVLVLENGAQIFINYSEDEIEIVEGLTNGDERFEKDGKASLVSVKEA